MKSAAQKLLAAAIEAEVARFLSEHGELKLADGRKRVVRHGPLPERDIQTGIAAVPVKMPPVRDQGDDGEKIRFSSNILPKYVRRAKSLEALIPWLYLKGVSSSQRRFVWPVPGRFDGVARRRCAQSVV